MQLSSMKQAHSIRLVRTSLTHSRLMCSSPGGRGGSSCWVCLGIYLVDMCHRRRHHRGNREHTLHTQQGQSRRRILHAGSLCAQRRSSSHEHGVKCCGGVHRGDECDCESGCLPRCCVMNSNCHGSCCLRSCCGLCLSGPSKEWFRCSYH